VTRAIALVAAAVCAGACASAGGYEWVRADGTPESAAVAERRSKDRATCATQMGAPTTGSQATMGYSRAEVEDCMRARGWKKRSD